MQTNHPQGSKGKAIAEDSLFTPLLPQEAPRKSRELLEQARRYFGFIPNLLASMAHSPMALSVYFHANMGFEFGTLTPAERQIVLYTASKENNCAYCSASHSALARFFADVPGETLVAIESGGRPHDSKLSALVSLTRELVSQRGFVSREAIQCFLDAGYTKEQLLDVLIGIGLKTISNYFDHVSALELDNEFQQMRSTQS